MRYLREVAAALATAGLLAGGLAACSSGRPSRGPTAPAVPATSASSPSPGGAGHRGSSSSATAAPTSRSSAAQPKGPQSKPGKAPQTSTSRSNTAAPQQKPIFKPGSIKETVPAKPVKTAKPISLDGKKAAVGKKISARLTNIRHQYVRSLIPGQLQGSSVVFDVVIENRSQQSIGLNNATVTVLDSKDDPAPELTWKPAKAFPAAVGAGESATGTFVFIVSKDRRNPITVDLTINAELQVVVFRGDAS